MPEEKWRHLIEIHNEGKSLFLAAEEIDREFRDFLQPSLELKHALEHVIRARAVQLGMQGEKIEDPEQYARDSFGKAIGHEYRAFFDAADWVSVRLREKITEALHPFSPACIKEVLPTYYPEMRPRIETICREIADIRGSKDISKQDDVLGEVKKYKGVIDELLGMHYTITQALPALLDWTSRNRRSTTAQQLALVILGILGTVAAAGLAWRLGFK